DEDERLVRLDDAAGTARAVGHRGGNRQLATTADAHPLDAAVTAGDHLPLAELERERLPSVPGRVELLAGRERDADVVHGDLLPYRRLLAVADDEVVDPELERDVAVRLVDLRSLECHAKTLSSVPGGDARYFGS